MLGWLVNYIAVVNHISELVAVVAGAVTVGFLAEIQSRLQKQPVTVYIVAGIIPLVPGTVAYRAMLKFMANAYDEGLVLAFKAFLIASYLAASLAIVPLVVRNIRVLKNRRSLLRKR